MNKQATLAGPYGETPLIAIQGVFYAMKRASAYGMTDADGNPIYEQAAHPLAVLDWLRQHRQYTYHALCLVETPKEADDLIRQVVRHLFDEVGSFQTGPIRQITLENRSRIIALPAGSIELVCGNQFDYIALFQTVSHKRDLYEQYLLPAILLGRGGSIVLHRTLDESVPRFYDPEEDHEDTIDTQADAGD